MRWNQHLGLGNEAHPSEISCGGRLLKGNADPQNQVCLLHVLLHDIEYILWRDDVICRIKVASCGTDTICTKEGQQSIHAYKHDAVLDYNVVMNNEVPAVRRAVLCCAVLCCALLCGALPYIALWHAVLAKATRNMQCSYVQCYFVILRQCHDEVLMSHAQSEGPLLSSHSRRDDYKGTCAAEDSPTHPTTNPLT